MLLSHLFGLLFFIQVSTTCQSPVTVNILDTVLYEPQLSLETSHSGVLVVLTLADQVYTVLPCCT